MLLTVLTGCKVDVPDVPDVKVSAADREACRTLIAALPRSVSGQKERETTGNPLGAAWGDPAIVLRCGVGPPADYDPLVGCQTVNGLDWYVPADGMNDQDKEVVLTTYGREPAVEVRLPAEYRPPVAAMVDLADTVEQHTRVLKECS